MTGRPRSSDAAPVPLTRRRRETRRRLVDAAFSLFAEHGIADTPVEIICERAGFTRGAFYSNFSSKEALFLALYEQEYADRIARLRRGVDELLDGPAPPELADAVARVIGLFTEHFAGDTTWYRLSGEFELHSLRRPEIREQIAAVLREFRNGMEESLRPLLDRMGLRLLVPVEDALLAFEAVYGAGLRRSLLMDAPAGVTVESVTPLLSRVVAALVEPVRPPAGR